MMDQENGLIMDMELVHVAETGGNSAAMEREGLSRILKRLQDNDVKVCQLATDRSVTVRSFMKKDWPNVDHQFDVWHFVKSVVKKLHKKDWPNVDHQFDVWHFVKSVVKKLHKKCKKKEFDNLRKWIPSIANHLWWSAATSQGDKVLLR